MKRKLQLMVRTSAASLLACSALAQYPISPELGQSADLRQPMVRPQANHLNGAAKASDLIGMTVKNYQGEKLGKVNNLDVDVESGRIIQVIVSSGGFIGMGDTLRAVPPGALHHDVAQKVLHLNASQEKFKAAPRFANSTSADGTQSNRWSEVYAYYDESPYFQANRDGVALSPTDFAYAQALPRNMDGTINTEGNSTVERTRNTEIARRLTQNYSMKSSRNADGTWAREYYLNGSETNASWTSFGYIQKASKVIGLSVKNRQDEKLGDVKNLLVDISSGRIVAVILSSGGFLGTGDELSAIPPNALRFTPDHRSLQLDTTREALIRAPHFRSNQWPDFNEPAYAGGVYRAYHVEPYFTSAPATADSTRRNVRDRVDRNPPLSQPDNAARNGRDQDNQALTPLDQGNSEADVTTTAQIRKEIIAGEDLSVNARNVKIITREGRVTLRGPVNTAAEKSFIEEIANRIARSENVDSQLEVKLPANSN
jgi:sporulation protein YlmC with PRC-barrel domain